MASEPHDKESNLRGLRLAAAASIAGGMIAASHRAHSVREALELMDRVEEAMQRAEAGTFTFDLETPHI